jgi:hypothetical protein
MSKSSNKQTAQIVASEPVAPVALATGTAMLASLASAANTPTAAQAPIAAAAALAHMQALPKHLAAKVASTVTGGTQAAVPAKLAGVVLITGKAHKARAPAEVVWANYCQTAAANGCTTADLLAGGASIGLGAHSVLAYIQRGWLVAAK